MDASQFLLLLFTLAIFLIVAIVPTLMIIWAVKTIIRSIKRAVTPAPRK